MSTSICWEQTVDGLVSRPWGVKDSHLLNTTEKGDKHRLQGPLGSYVLLEIKHSICWNLNKILKIEHNLSIFWLNTGT